MKDPQPLDAPSRPGSPDLPGYFVVRVRRTSGTLAGEVSGVVERLGSGEKREFQSSQELARVVEEWSR
ncbi:MAG: hypothetical protein ABJD11_10750 [Gemmatimonadota bacterium]